MGSGGRRLGGCLEEGQGEETSEARWKAEPAKWDVKQQGQGQDLRDTRMKPKKERRGEERSRTPQEEA